MTTRKQLRKELSNATRWTGKLEHSRQAQAGQVSVTAALRRSCSCPGVRLLRSCMSCSHAHAMHGRLVEEGCLWW